MGDDNKNLMSLKDTAVYMGLTPETVRTLLRKKKLVGAKDDSGRWKISPKNADSYLANKGTKKNMKVAYIVNLTYKEYIDIKAYLDTKGIGIKKRYAKKKPKK